MAIAKIKLNGGSGGIGATPKMVPTSQQIWAYNLFKKEWDDGKGKFGNVDLKGLVTREWILRVLGNRTKYECRKFITDQGLNPDERVIFLMGDSSNKNLVPSSIAGVPIVFVEI